MKSFQSVGELNIMPPNNRWFKKNGLHSILVTPNTAHNPMVCTIKEFLPLVEKLLLIGNVLQSLRRTILTLGPIS